MTEPARGEFDRPGANLSALAALAAMAGLLAFGPALFGRTVVDRPEVFDLGNQWLAFAAFLRRTYLLGHFPLWDPHDLCGMPFLAFAHTGSLYLPWVLTHVAWALYAPGAAVDIFIHLALAAIAAFALFRGAGRSAPAALIGAAAYAFSGFIFGNINFPPSLHTGAWLACWYAAAFALLDRRTACSFALATLALAAMVFGGDAEMLIYAGLGLGFELVLRRKEKGLSRAGLVALLGSGFLGLGASSAQLLPALELNHFSIRAGEAFYFTVHPALLVLFPLLALFQIPVPSFFYFSNHGLDQWYFGAFLILAAAWGLRRFAYVRWRMLIFPAAGIYLLLFYAPPFNLVTSRIPILGGLMVPLRLWPVLELFFLLAATFALDQWAEKPDPSARPLPGGRAGAIYLMIFGAATAVSLYWVRQGILVRLVFAMALIGVGFFALRKQSVLAGFSRRGKSTLALLLVLLDLYGLALTYLPGTDPQKFEPDPRLVSFLQNTSGQERYQIVSIRGILDPGLPYHLGLRLQADTGDAFTRVPPAAAARRLARLYPSLLRRQEGRLVQYDQMSVRDPKNLARDQLELLNRMNVTMIVSRYPWSGPAEGLELEPVLLSPDLSLYRNLKAGPRARAEIEGREVALAVEHPAPDQVQIMTASMREKEFAVLLAESYYPGWQAEVAGREVKLEPDELGFRLLTGRGGEDVVMRFVPRSFRIGLWSSLASLFCLLLSRRFWKSALTKPAR